jgi:urease accessory protein
MHSNLIRLRRGAVVAIACLPAAVSAHAGHGDIAGFGDGMLHVASGLDHMLAAVAVGLWSMAWPIRRAWMLPVAYVLAMSAATWFGVGREAGPSLETMLVATIIVLGGLVATSRHMPEVAAALVVAVFGAIHGYAHGAEAGTSGSIPMYIVGLASATLALHVAGMGFGLMLRLTSRWGMRVAGAVIAGAGVWFAISAA